MGSNLNQVGKRAPSGLLYRLFMKLPYLTLIKLAINRTVLDEPRSELRNDDCWNTLTVTVTPWNFANHPDNKGPRIDID